MADIKNDNLSKWTKWTSLIVVVIGTFMAILDSSIVNVAIPKLISVFSSTVDQSRWIITAYSLTMGAVIPLTGYLCHNFGTKKVYIFAMALFTVGSMLCGIAWSTQSMIFFRIIQGVGGGLIMPVSMAIIYDIVDQSEIGMALGLWGIAAMAAPAIGPTLSGYIIQYLDWRLIYTINIPIGVVGVLLSLILLKEHEKTPERSFDYLGFITATIGIVLCLYVLGEGATNLKEFKNILMLTIGFFSLLLFAVNELTHPHPLLNLRLLKIPIFSLSILISSVLSMALFGFVFIFPLYLQNLRGYTPMQTGMIMLPSAIMTAITMPISGVLLDKFGPKPLMVPSLVLLTAATFEMARITPETSITWIIILTVIRGLALGFCMMPATTTGMKHVPQQQVAGASALSNAIRQISSAISITFLTSVLQRQQELQYYKNVEHMSQFQPAVTNWISSFQGYLMSGGLQIQEAATATMSALSGIVQIQVFTVAMQNTLMVTVLFSLIAIPLSWFVKSPDEVQKSETFSEILKEGGQDV